MRNDFRLGKLNMTINQEKRFRNIRKILILNIKESRNRTPYGELIKKKNVATLEDHGINE